jgi:hypothetical protein
MSSLLISIGQVGASSIRPLVLGVMLLLGGGETWEYG